MDIRQIIEELRLLLQGKDGYQIKQIEDVGKNIMINCPYHAGGNESNPSFGLLKEQRMTRSGLIPQGFGNCFACGAKVPLEKLIEDTLKADGESIGSWLKEKGYTGKPSEFRKALAELTYDEHIIKKVPYEGYSGYYEYMAYRGISEATAKQFDLGYSTIEEALIIPVRDRDGKNRMTIRRFTNPNSRAKFHNTGGSDKRDVLHGKYEILQDPELLKKDFLFIVESSIDMMLLMQIGYPTVATMQAIPTEEQLQQINLMPQKKIVVATDNDKAGKEGADRYYKSLENKSIWRVKFPDNVKDIGDFTEDERRKIQIEFIKTGIKEERSLLSLEP